MEAKRRKEEARKQAELEEQKQVGSCRCDC
jgi:hypothetical protein